MLEYQTQFLKKLKAFGPYLVEFHDDGFIEEKRYFSDCVVNGFNKKLVILITHNENTFLANDNQYQA